LGVQAGDLDDVAHDVFVIVHRRFDSFDGISRVTTWLFGICMRVAANYRRRQRRAPSEAALRARVREEVAVAVPADELLARREERAIAERLLAMLSLEKRAVFVMFEIESISCQEIAQTMGVPIGTIYSRLHAARRQLSELLRRHLPRNTR
jgi:RNA polymerase sigma-70 factor (ECF subfamily)